MLARGARLGAAGGDRRRVGAVIAAFAPPALFKIVFAVIASLIAFKLLVGRDTWKIADELPRAPVMRGLRLFSRAVFVPDGRERRLDLQHDPDAVRQADPSSAVATSAGLGVPITIAGTIGYMLAGLPLSGAAAAAVDRLRLAWSRSC